jgi:hypothetical protein
MDDTQIATVRCTTCGTDSHFTPDAVPPAAQTSRVKKATRSPAPKARTSRAKKSANGLPSGAPLWEAKIAAATGKEHRYTRQAIYRIGDIVLHEQFGKGIVLKLATKKCYVLFQDKERLMASAN